MDCLLSSQSLLPRLVNWKYCKLASKSKGNALSVQFKKVVRRRSVYFILMEINFMSISVNGISLNKFNTTNYKSVSRVSLSVV